MAMERGESSGRSFETSFLETTACTTPESAKPRTSAQRSSQNMAKAMARAWRTWCGIIPDIGTPPVGGAADVSVTRQLSALTDHPGDGVLGKPRKAGLPRPGTAVALEVVFPLDLQGDLHEPQRSTLFLAPDRGRCRPGGGIDSGSPGFSEHRRRLFLRRRLARAVGDDGPAARPAGPGRARRRALQLLGVGR